MSPTPQLAKLSRPRLYRVMPRERLFRLMDERRDHPVMWVAGAPGSGKSSLVASYLETRKLGGVWYQFDTGDADPATFFYYLGLAAPSIAGRKLPPLPLFTDEYRRSLEPFARRWFREFFARMPIGALLVFDNLQDAGGTSEARAALAAGLEETPLGLNVIVVSRAEPPPEFARLIVNQTIARVGPNDLRFTREEAAALLATHGEVDAHVVERIYERSDGWAAGLILMREHARRDESAPSREALATPEAVFAYFAGEIFNRIPPAEQRVLALCAVPPRITASIAVALTGEIDAGKILEQGYRRHLFIARRDGAEPSYEFHALFRQFLLARARKLLSADELAHARRRAAELIEAGAASEGVFELYRDAGDWSDALRVTLADAPELVAHGRFHSLVERVDALPPAVRESEAWLAYWEGLARVNVDPLAARDCLRRAYDGFSAQGDEAAQMLSAEAVIISHYLARDDWRPADPWLEAMGRLIGGRSDFATPETEARAVSSLAIGLVYRQPGHPRLLEYLDRLDALLDTLNDKNAKVALATRLIDGLNKVGSLARSQHVARRIRPVIDDPEVRPLTSAWCRVWMVSIASHEGRMAEVDTLLAEALAIVETHGLAFFVPVVNIFRTWGWLARGELNEAEQGIARVAVSVDPARKIDLGLFHFFTAWAAALAGDFAAAEREGRIAAQIALATGSITSMLTSHTVLALALDENGHRAEAAEVFERANRLVADLRGGMLRFHAGLWNAYLRLRRGDETYRAALAEALALGRREGYFTNYLWWPPMMSRLAAVAIEEAIEPDYVRQLVAARGVPPDEALAADSWPWPLKIRALGRFEVLSDGKPLAFRGKAQKKPIDLLKALVALGGEGVDASRLSAALWSDATGDAAKVSFDSTLYRLRKLLANDAALVLNEGRLSLDRRQCWVDVWAFERIARAAESATAGTAADAAAQLLSAYPGHFLAGDEDQPWAIGLRDRLRSKLVRTVLMLGKTLQAEGRWEDAITLYQRALEQDNLAEDLYRGLMVCCRELGRLSEALQTYRRCRELLSVVLGLQPSAETEALRQSLIQPDS